MPHSYRLCHPGDGAPLTLGTLLPLEVLALWQWIWAVLMHLEHDSRLKDFQKTVQTIISHMRSFPIYSSAR